MKDRTTIIIICLVFMALGLAFLFSRKKHNAENYFNEHRLRYDYKDKLGTNYYVDRDFGNDSSSGSRLSPFATLEHAIIIADPNIDYVFEVIEYKDFKIEKEIENSFNEIIQKKFYAFIIDQNSPHYRYDRYEVFLLDSPNLEDYDPNESDWFLIDSFKICGSDPNCVKRVMKYKMDDGEMSKINWEWGE